MKKIINTGYKHIIKILLFFVAVISVQASAHYPSLKNGRWRASIVRPDGHEIIFNFETKDSARKKILYIINGSEHLLVDSILFHEDSVFIELPFFESGFRAKINEDGNLEGVWIKHYGKIVQTLPFKAEYGVKKRFPVSAPPAFNISGRWPAVFRSRNGRTSQLVGKFKQSGSYLTGTFRDPTGDYRFLEGVVSGDSLTLSAFDGAHALLFTARIDDENKISDGFFYSGARSIEKWSAVQNSNADLPDAFNETKIKPGAGSPDFHFRDSRTGKQISIKDEQYKNKVVVIQILGSWCPNCMDETKFLSEYYNDPSRNKNVEIIGLAYERTIDFTESQKALEPFRKRFNVQYPLLVTGVTVSDSLRTEKTLPQLDNITAFPTTIFLDKKGNIRKIHTGFDGPATGNHYTQFKKEFEEIIDQLLAEK